MVKVKDSRNENIEEAVNNLLKGVTKNYYSKREIPEEPSEDKCLIPETFNDLLQIKNDNIDVNSFKTIESIVNYLQTQYGFDKFKKIYERVFVLDGRLRGRVIFDSYAEGLKTYLTTSQIEKHLALFLI